MKGLELAERFFLEHGEPMLKDNFSNILPLVSVGLMVEGSECLGYDDEISADHDFEAGFIIFLPDEEIVDRRTAFSLERAYSKLPREFMGVKRSILSPVGGNRHGVMRISEFLMRHTGTEDGRLTLDEWFNIPEQSLLEVTNGKIFFDGSGELTRVRESLSYLPSDVRLKKLAGHLLLMGQSGQYNYKRCIVRGDAPASALSAFEFVKSAVHTVFLINSAYLPYYKWQFKALSELPILSELYTPLAELISAPTKNAHLIEEISEKIIIEIKKEGLSSIDSPDLERHAYAVNDRISDGEVRNLNVLYGI